MARRVNRLERVWPNGETLLVDDQQVRLDAELRGVVYPDADRGLDQLLELAHVGVVILMPVRNEDRLDLQAAHGRRDLFRLEAAVQDVRLTRGGVRDDENVV